MLKKNVIQKSDSPWASPVTLVKKPNGKWRFCIDFRKLNEITRKDSHPIPRTDTIFDKFNGSKWYSTMDMASGFWQIEMKEEDREKTAFITHEGLYEWLVMPFGLTNAPATFQRTMQLVLEELFYTIAPVYIDDIIVHSKTFEEHIKDLEKVFKKIRKANLKLGPDKCKFCFNEIKFLGHIVGKDGIKTDLAKIEKVKNYPRPMNITQLRGFLGLAKYYRKFIKDFAKIAKPLNDLTKGFKSKPLEIRDGIKMKRKKTENEKNRKDEKFTDNWGKKQEEAFEILKEKLINSPVLIYPNFEKEFILYTDASRIALGAVLHQEGEDNKEHVIAYENKTLNKAEQNYSITELECLAVVWAVEKFDYYLEGNKFKIITDHIALKWLFNKAIPKGRIGRWIARLQPYICNMEIIHKSGKKHTNADALSRIKFEMKNENEEEYE
jgi:RNase H-like domain found in reverse transcriptase/Reverse transcriptase (RNA-dependent DNA polymerase)